MSRSANHYFTGAGASGTANYIEDVFSTFVYTGTGVNRTIDNGISLGYKSTPAQTSVSGRLRDYEGVDYFYNIGANQGTFLGATNTNWQAGEWIKVDFITPVSVFTCTYRNSIPQSAGSSWAPSSIELQSSDDDTNWTTRVSYNDQTGSEAINGAVQYIHYTGGVTARYWRMLQATNTRGGSNGYNWGFGSFGMYTGSLGNGGLVWIKGRNAARNHNLIDTERGLKTLYSEFSQAQDLSVTSIRAFNDTNSSSLTPSGFTLGTENSVNFNGDTFCAWTFRQQPKFFDVVTYTGNGAASRNIAHNLGSVPGCIINKALSISENWGTYHRSTGANGLYLNATNTAGVTLVPTGHTNTTFEVANGYGLNNSSGVTYVAYLFAHDAGGFGLTGTNNVISCGSWSTTLVGGRYDAIIDLGWEPQWILFKPTNNTGNWQIYDNMRGWTANPAGSNASQRLYPSLSNAEDTDTNTQLQYDGIGKVRIAVGASGYSGIYVAIRKGPMKVPTSGTSVFSPVTYTGDNSNTRVISTGFPPDMVWTGPLDPGGRRAGDRLRGLFTNPGPVNYTYATGEETFDSYSLPQMSGWQTGNGTVRFENSTAVNYVLHAFKRAPGFFDIVCYTGTGANTTFTHNLGVVPELLITKNRTSAGYGWLTYSATLGATKFVQLNSTAAEGTVATYWNNTAPTSSVFSVGTAGATNASADNFVAYLFATCAGVSKVGSYTGTGTTLQVNCGFATGARFVMIKRTDDTGNWFVWDTARGIIAGNDPYLLLNSSAAEVTNTDYIDSYSPGFELSSTAPAALNASGGTYIFLAIA